MTYTKEYIEKLYQKRLEALKSGKREEWLRYLFLASARYGVMTQEELNKFNKMETMMSNFEKIEVNCSNRALSEDTQEYFDKIYGRPCTDMYYFRPLSEEELNENNFLYGWKSVKKENITDDQKTKRLREEYPEYDIENKEIVGLNLMSNDIEKMLQEKIKEERDDTILNQLMKLKGDNNE